MSLNPHWEIRFAHGQDQLQWDSYVANHPQGCAYHFWGFKEAIASAYGFSGPYFMAMQGNRVRGVLPLICIRFPWTQGGLFSLPYCDAAGPLADSRAIEKVLVSAAMAHADARGIQSFEIRSSHALSTDPWNGRVDNGMAHGKVKMSRALPSHPDGLLASLKSKVRSQVKKPMRDGLAVCMGGRELLKEFYSIYCENMRDLGSPAHSMGWFTAILKGYGNRAHVGLVRLPDGTPAAAGIILCHPHQVSIPWASSLRRFNRLNPNMLLYWQFLSFAISWGYPSFDFGRSTLGEGSFRFKAQWGALDSPLHWARFSTGTGSQGSKTPSLPSGALEYRALGALALSKTPVPILKWVGRKTRKFISL